MLRIAHSTKNIRSWVTEFIKLLNPAAEAVYLCTNASMYQEYLSIVPKTTTHDNSNNEAKVASMIDPALADVLIKKHSDLTKAIHQLSSKFDSISMQHSQMADSVEGDDMSLIKEKQDAIAIINQIVIARGSKNKKCSVKDYILKAQKRISYHRKQQDTQSQDYSDDVIDTLKSCIEVLKS